MLRRDTNKNRIFTPISHFSKTDIGLKRGFSGLCCLPEKNNILRAYKSEMLRTQWIINAMIVHVPFNRDMLHTPMVTTIHCFELYSESIELSHSVSSLTAGFTTINKDFCREKDKATLLL